LINADEDSPLEDQLPDKGVDAAAEALNSCERELFERGMAGLPARQGRLLRALYFEGDSVAQLAGRWGINAQAVQNIHVKALKALRVRLKRLGVRRADG
jgi:DNA-directed RNA polymerase specialized sigma24 family protein